MSNVSAKRGRSRENLRIGTGGSASLILHRSDPCGSFSETFQASLALLYTLVYPAFVMRLPSALLRQLFCYRPCASLTIQQPSYGLVAPSLSAVGRSMTNSKRLREGLKHYRAAIVFRKTSWLIAILGKQSYFIANRSTTYVPTLSSEMILTVSTHPMSEIPGVIWNFIGWGRRQVTLLKDANLHTLPVGKQRSTECILRYPLRWLALKQLLSQLLRLALQNTWHSTTEFTPARARLLSNTSDLGPVLGPFKDC